MLARLSPGEFVVNAGATARHRAVLEIINRGALGLPGHADGGVVAGPNISSYGALRRPPNFPPAPPVLKALMAQEAGPAAKASAAPPNMDGNALRRNDEVPAASTPAGCAVAAVAARG